MVEIAEKQLIKVLICDDDPADRKLVCTYLKRMVNREIVVLQAGKSHEIQNALEKGRVDLILMDVHMPEKSGMDWLREIVKNQTAPVVMLTGAANEEIAVQSIEEGACGYIPKSSLNREKLFNAINTALDKWKKLQQSKADMEEIERLIHYDALTSLYNRRTIIKKLDDHLNHTIRYSENFTLIMLDIDHFKEVNDYYGHLVGDDALEYIACIIKHSLRKTDIAGRYGGDEFVIILPKTDLATGEQIAQRIRRNIEAAEMTDHSGNTFHITISQGICCFQGNEKASSLIARADNALYKAKKDGRNRVEVSS